MADDARTEARRRIAEVLHDHRRVAANCACGARAHLHRWHQANAVLDLFPKADWYEIAVPGMVADPQVWTYRRQLRLTGPVELHPEHPDPVEPVTEESPHDPSCQMLIKPPSGFPFDTFSCNCNAVPVPEEDPEEKP
jgi:hypothetical protein